MSNATEATHLRASAAEITNRVRAIERALVERAALEPVEFALPVTPRGPGIERAQIVFERRQGTWGIYVHEVPAAVGMLLGALMAASGQQVPRTLIATSITPINDAPLVVRSQFLEQSELFVGSVLAAMNAARAAAAPALAAGDRALAMLGASVPVGTGSSAQIAALGSTAGIAALGTGVPPSLAAAVDDVVATLQPSPRELSGHRRESSMRSREIHVEPRVVGVVKGRSR